MEDKLKQLLNSLIEKGWKPRNCNYQKYEDGCLIYEKVGNNGVYSIGQYPVSLREITSRNSGLWQFVCENGMIPKECHERVKDISWGEYGPDCKAQINLPTAEYRLIESALKDESELEDFLLSNIKIEGNENIHDMTTTMKKK